MALNKVENVVQIYPFMGDNCCAHVPKTHTLKTFVKWAMQLKFLTKARPGRISLILAIDFMNNSIPSDKYYKDWNFLTSPDDASEFRTENL